MASIAAYAMDDFCLALASAPSTAVWRDGTALYAPVVAPSVILICCAVAGLFTAFLLPKRAPKGSIRTKVAGLSVLVAFVVLLGNVLNYTASLEGTGVWGFFGMGPYFWIFAILALASSVRVITHPKPVYSALWFVMTIFASAGLFILLTAEFLAAALVTIYAGAILVTYTFVIMLAADAGVDRGTDREGAVREFLADHDANARMPLIASATGFTIAGLILFLVFAKAPQTVERNGPLALNPYAPVVDGGESLAAVGSVDVQAAPIVRGQTQELGVYLFSNQVVALQVAGLILTVAMIGAIVIARKKVILPEHDRYTPGDGLTRDVVSTPHTPIEDNPNSLPIRGTSNPRQKAYPQT
ncbi:MAG: NADH-quinone oxidoreductase subunit J [Planctomycetota bacterium]